MKKISKLSSAVALTVGLSGTLYSQPTKAETDNSIPRIDEQLNQIENQIIKMDNEIDLIHNQKVLLAEQIKRYEDGVKRNENFINKLEVRMNVLDIEIQSLEKEIQLSESRLGFLNLQTTVSYPVIDKQISSNVQTGLVDKKFPLSRIEALSELFNHQQELHIRIKEYETLSLEFNGMKEMLSEQILEKSSLLQRLEEKEQAQIQEKEDLTVESQTLTKQKSVMETAVEHEKARVNGEALDLNYGDPIYPGFPNEDGKIEIVAVQEHPVSAVGNRWIGKSVYVFGGGRNSTDIIQGRFDCSSFVHWAFKQVGRELGPLTSVSTETLKRLGEPVSLNNILPGDLVFFDTYKKDGHVGIYIGDGKFIGAQSSSGVGIADMSSGYWKERFNHRIKRINL